jgi:hypothetical protein
MQTFIRDFEICQILSGQRNRDIRFRARRSQEDAPVSHNPISNDLDGRAAAWPAPRVRKHHLRLRAPLYSAQRSDGGFAKTANSVDVVATQFDNSTAATAKVSGRMAT